MLFLNLRRLDFMPPCSTVATPQGSRASFISSSIIRCRRLPATQGGCYEVLPVCCCRFCCFFFPPRALNCKGKRGRNKTGLHDKHFSEKDCRPLNTSETMDHGAEERLSVTLFLKETTTNLLLLLYHAQRVGEFCIIQMFYVENLNCALFFTRSAAVRIPEFRYVRLPVISNTGE